MVTHTYSSFPILSNTWPFPSFTLPLPASLMRPCETESSYISQGQAISNSKSIYKGGHRVFCIHDRYFLRIRAIILCGFKKGLTIKVAVRTWHYALFLQNIMVTKLSLNKLNVLSLNKTECTLLCETNNSREKKFLRLSICQEVAGIIAFLLFNSWTVCMCNQEGIKV